MVTAWQDPDSKFYPFSSYVHKNKKVFNLAHSAPHDQSFFKWFAVCTREIQSKSKIKYYFLSCSSVLFKCLYLKLLKKLGKTAVFT